MSDAVPRLLSFGKATAASFPPSVAARTVALGWATVELDRASKELGRELGITPDRFVVAPDTRLLGARCRVAAAVLPDGSSLAILEPATEGRLAATLARAGEGPVAIWLAAATGRAADAEGRAPDASAVPFATSSEREGPFGVERLILGGPRHGPHRLLVGSPGTIR
jgi:hypothetical protein